MQATRVQAPSRLQIFAALKQPSYRRFWSGMVASVLGFQIMTVAQGWLVYDLTGSKLYLGYVGLAAGLPAVVLNLFGGVVADKIDKRRLLLVTQTTASLLMFTLATLTLMDVVQVWHVLVIALLTGSVQAFDNPTRMALFPHLIERKDLQNAVALNAMVWQGTGVVGPALGGIIIATRLGVAPGFYAAFLGFLLMAVMIFTLKVPLIPRAGGSSFFQDMGQGLSYIRSHSIFAVLIAMTFFNAVFGMAYIFLLPVFAKDILQVGASGLGYLYAASGTGALLGTLTMATLTHVRYKGWLLLGGATFFGAFLILFATTSHVYASVPVALLLLFLVGVSTSLYMVSIMTTLQSLVPDALRGRVMGIYGMTWSLVPVGAMLSGAIAEYTSAPFAVGLGGAAVLLFALGMAVVSREVRQLGRQAS